MFVSINESFKIKLKPIIKRNLVKLGPFMPICHQYKGMLPKWASYAHPRPVIKVGLQGKPSYHSWPVDMDL